MVGKYEKQAIDDANRVRYEHTLKLFRAKGVGKMGDIHGLPQSRLAILPGTPHIGMMQQTEWLLPMINGFLYSNFNAAPPSL